MQITIIGMILIPIGFFCFLLAPSFLYTATVFFIAFTATSILNTAGDDASGISAGIFFLLLCLLREFIDWLISGKFSFSSFEFAFVVRALLFLFSIAASFLALLSLEGKVMIMSPILFDDNQHYLSFSSRNYTQFFYLVVGLSLSYLLIVKNKSIPQIRTTLKIYIASSLFVCGWGLFQMLSSEFNFPYPDWLFNSSASKYAAGFSGTMGDIGVKRLSSVAVEPSILAGYLLSSIAFLLASVFFKSPIYSSKIDFVSLLTVFITLSFCMSSTAYIGLFFIIAIFGSMLFLIDNRFARSFIVAAVVGIFLFTTLYIGSPLLRTIIDTLLFSKSTSYSALERLGTIVNAWEYFSQHPVLGLGWGSVTSHDLVVNILANSGIVGFAGFLFLITYIYKTLNSARIGFIFSEITFEVYLIIAATLSFTTQLFVSVFSGFGYVFGHFWFVMGITASIAGTIITARKAGSSPL